MARTKKRADDPPLIRRMADKQPRQRPAGER